MISVATFSMQLAHLAWKFNITTNDLLEQVFMVQMSYRALVQ